MSKHGQRKFIDALNSNTSHKYVGHVRKVEEVSCVTNALVEEGTEYLLIDWDSDESQDTDGDMSDEDDDDDDDSGV